VVSAWESLEGLRAGENPVFQDKVAHILSLCQPGATLREEDVLLCEFPQIVEAQAKPSKRKPSRPKTKKKATKAKRRK
jgi:hypothetical protein